MTDDKNTAQIVNIDIACFKENTFPDYIKKEQSQALRNLLAGNRFQPLHDNSGPYDVSLSIEESRLVMRMRNAAAQDLNVLVLSLKPYRRLIQDYFLMLESYEQTRHCATREKLETIDMGRRALHNEGADLLLARLEDKICMDHETARKLFTLICVLHRGAFMFAA
ncbi:MAG: hypothetical protein CO093_11405 [Alphaproteobacteria bacterium CG_4_9_14_3_um_filter_47_13]|nr:MAG: hypothetical protein CO093_11405 [Alphaproteobacteria bacterium CG_4_9_14_3_um_filter_47_13]